MKDYEDTREWLVRAIRILEKTTSISNVLYFPTPMRAITFAQTQLSNVLIKLGYEEEGKKVLQKAAEFHVQQAQQQITQFHLSQRTVNIALDKQQGGGEVRDGHPEPGFHGKLVTVNEENNVDNTRLDSARSNNSNQSNNSKSKKSKINPREKHQPRNNNEVDAKVHQLNLIQSSAYNLVVPIILKNTPLDEEIQTSINLMNEIMNLCLKNGDKYEASVHAEDIAKLAESAFGWDSVESAEAYRQVGLRCMALEDWPRAIKALHLSVEAYAAIYPRTDPKFVSVQKLYEKAKTARQQAAQGLPIDNTTENANQEEKAPESAESPNVKATESEVAATKDAITADMLFTNAEAHLHDSVEHQLHISHPSSQPGTPLKFKQESLHPSPRKISTPSSPTNEYEEFDDFYPASPMFSPIKS